MIRLAIGDEEAVLVQQVSGLAFFSGEGFERLETFDPIKERRDVG